jgi:hypothetical protein
MAMRGHGSGKPSAKRNRRLARITNAKGTERFPCLLLFKVPQRTALHSDTAVQTPQHEGNSAAVHSEPLPVARLDEERVSVNPFRTPNADLRQFLCCTCRVRTGL